MVKVSNLGYARLGENREWKKLIESYWSGKLSQADLLAEMKSLRRTMDVTQSISLNG